MKELDNFAQNKLEKRKWSHAKGLLFLKDTWIICKSLKVGGNRLLIIIKLNIVLNKVKISCSSLSASNSAGVERNWHQTKLFGYLLSSKVFLLFSSFVSVPLSPHRSFHLCISFLSKAYEICTLALSICHCDLKT